MSLTFPTDPTGMAVKRTTPSMGRILALLAGTAGLGFGSTAVAQRHEHELLERSVRVRPAQRAAPHAATPRGPKPTSRRSLVATRPPKHQRAVGLPRPHRSPQRTPAPTPARAPAAAPAPAAASATAPVPAIAQGNTTPPQAAAPVLQAPAQAPVPATPAPVAVVAGGS